MQDEQLQRELEQLQRWEDRIHMMGLDPEWATVFGGTLAVRLTARESLGPEHRG